MIIFALSVTIYDANFYKYTARNIYKKEELSPVLTSKTLHCAACVDDSFITLKQLFLR